MRLIYPGSIPAPDTFPAYCFSTDLVGDAVYIMGPKVGNYFQVTKVNYDDSSWLKSIAVGIIIEKPLNSEAIVQTSGEMKGVYSGLSPGATLFHGFQGRLVETIDRPSIGTRVVQPVGYALSSDSIAVNIQRPFRIGIA